MSTCEQCPARTVAVCARCKSHTCRSHTRRGTWRGQATTLCTYCHEYDEVTSKNGVPAGTPNGVSPPESPRDLLSVRAIAMFNEFGDKSDLWLMWYFGNNTCDVV